MHRKGNSEERFCQKCDEVVLHEPIIDSVDENCFERGIMFFSTMGFSELVRSTFDKYWKCQKCKRLTDRQ